MLSNLEGLDILCNVLFCNQQDDEWVRGRWWIMDLGFHKAFPNPLQSTLLLDQVYFGLVNNPKYIKLQLSIQFFKDLGPVKI